MLAVSLCGQHTLAAVPRTCPTYQTRLFSSLFSTFLRNPPPPLQPPPPSPRPYPPPPSDRPRYSRPPPPRLPAGWFIWFNDAFERGSVAIPREIYTCFVSLSFFRFSSIKDHRRRRLPLHVNDNSHGN